MAKTLQPGDPAPEVVLPDQDGNTRKLSDLRGQWVLVYFYPRDDTPGCTVEACGLRDKAADYAKAGVTVFGISADNAKSHRKFADKFQLPFALLADEQKTVIQAFGAWGRKRFMGREFDGILRQSFLVDPKGRIAKVYDKVKPEGHAEEVLADVLALKGGPAAPAAKPATKASAKSSVKPAPKTPAAAKKAPTKARGEPRPSSTRRSQPKPKR
jgi:peroxiredoxin Q/BCP